ncbi:hypothetical protein GNP80_05300 [Aliivibrio fischeri]|uniref:toxic anion resistance protein n=1 Tax=Aliivibrio fischeri TaxID=668 RepID=UPI0012D890C2|nr:toxic anion resistance protein [Aliivibrio fischeri]MUK91853.1 hypothetical protein [Aliivibrio fischeri]
MVFQPKIFQPMSAQVTQNVEATLPATNEVMTVNSFAIATPVANDLPNFELRIQTAVELYQNELQEAGLNPQEVGKLVSIQLKEVNVYSDHGIAQLGLSSAEKIGEYSDSILKHVRTKDLESMGENLNQVIGLAKGVDIQSLIGKDSFFGKVVAKFKNTKESILSQFNSVSTQLERIVKEIDKQQVSLRERSNQLEVVFTHNITQYKSLAQSIVYGEARKGLIEDRVILLSAEVELHNSPMKLQELHDLQSIQSRIEKRIHDLKSLQMLALQTAPMIRMVQSNNITLIEKFDNIKTLTIPSWKKQFTLAVSMLEQKKSMELASKIDDATNDLIRKNADLLRQNTLQNAQMSQRSAIDIETLEYVQNTLISTLQDVVAIEQEGARNRQAADEKMITMKSELSNFLKYKKGNN